MTEIYKNKNRVMMDEFKSPFGGASRLISTTPTGYIQELYRRKCNVDISHQFRGNNAVTLHECLETGYRFWRPEDISGDDELYRQLSHAWPTYYRTDRWEYALAKRWIQPKANVIEVGCGRGYFLRSIEPLCSSSLGLELNTSAAEDSVTKSPIRVCTVEEAETNLSGSFDVACSFQVLEHIADPAIFLTAMTNLLKPGGYLLLSTPNYDYHSLINPEDAFDLPPHHMGYFNEAIFRKVARWIGLSVREVSIERRKFIAPTTLSNTLALRMARLVSSRSYNFAYRTSLEPGPNIFVCLQKKSARPDCRA
jgi:2-polyprenyl-3-methyl-5-hydroxy-6-metoxy-1,4-benzoquinol methylase